MDDTIIRFLNSPIANYIVFGLGVSAIIGFFWFLFYTGSDKKKKHLYTKIKNLQPEIKELFDSNIPLKEDIQFFSYGVKDHKNSVFTHGYIAFLLICLVIPFTAILLGEILNEVSIIAIQVTLCLVVVYWRYSIYKKHRDDMKNTKYRYGIFILKDKLLIRGEEWNECIVLKKDHIKEVKDCKLYTSDSSEDDGIKFMISKSNNVATEELNISGEFFGTNNEKVIQAIKEWKYLHYS